MTILELMKLRIPGGGTMKNRSRQISSLEAAIFKSLAQAEDLMRKALFLHRLNLARARVLAELYSRQTNRLLVLLLRSENRRARPCRKCKATKRTTGPERVQ
jgi:hypothetical protein